MKKTQKKQKIDKITMRIFKNFQKINGYYYKYILDEEKIHYLYKALRKYSKIKSGATTSDYSKLSQTVIMFILDIEYRDKNLQVLYEAFEKVCNLYGGKSKSGELYDILVKIIKNRSNLELKNKELEKIKSELDPQQRKLKLILMMDDIIMAKEGETHDKDIDDITSKFNSIRNKIEKKFIKDSNLKKMAKILNKKTDLYDTPIERSDYFHETISFIRASRIKNLKYTVKSMEKKSQSGGTIEIKGEDDCGVDDLSKRRQDWFGNADVRKEIGNLFYKNNIHKNPLFDCYSVTDEEFNKMIVQEQNQYIDNARWLYYYYKEFPGKVDKYHYNTYAAMKSQFLLQIFTGLIQVGATTVGALARVGVI